MAARVAVLKSSCYDCVEGGAAYDPQLAGFSDFFSKHPIRNSGSHSPLDDWGDSDRISQQEPFFVTYRTVTYRTVGFFRIGGKWDISYI